MCCNRSVKTKICLKLLELRLYVQVHGGNAQLARVRVIQMDAASFLQRVRPSELCEDARASPVPHHRPACPAFACGQA